MKGAWNKAAKIIRPVYLCTNAWRDVSNWRKWGWHRKVQVQKYLNGVSITDDKGYGKIMKNNNKLKWVGVWLVCFFVFFVAVNATQCSIRRFPFLSWIVSQRRFNFLELIKLGWINTRKHTVWSNSPLAERWMTMICSTFTSLSNCKSKVANAVEDHNCISDRKFKMNAEYAVESCYWPCLLTFICLLVLTPSYCKHSFATVNYEWDAGLDSSEAWTDFRG